MKGTSIILLTTLTMSLGAWGQGIFLFANGAPTHVGSLDGALASTNIWGQMLAGPSADSLSPVGIALRHHSDGTIGGVRPTTVPSALPFTFAYVQMVAWDGLLWGSNLAGVPLDQLGRTDIVTVYLTDGGGFPPAVGPSFSQSAIVPVPEPAAWALLALAGGVVLGSRFTRRRCRPHRN